MQRTTFGVLLALLLVVVAAGPAAAEDEPSDDFVIDSFVSEVALQDDGTLAVSETIAVDFAEEPHHGIFRVLPLRYPADADDVPADAPADRGPEDYWREIEVDDLSVTATAPADLQRETEGGELVLRIGDEDTEVTGTQTYELSYTVTGALDRADDLAELRWNVTGAGWQVPMRGVEARVTAPAPIAEAGCAVGAPGSTTPCASADANGEVATYAAEGLEPGEQLTVRATVPADAVTIPPPIVAERFRLSRALVGDPLAWPLAAVVALLAFGALALALRRGRDEAAPHGRGGPVRFDPPEDLSPAELSVVLDEKVDERAMSATLVDLAERGFLEIEDRGDPDDRDDRDWWLRRTARGAWNPSVTPRGDDGDPLPLRDYERALLDALFADASEVRLSDLKGEFHESYTRFRDDVYATSVARGWFPRSPARVRGLWLGISLAALAGSIALLVAAVLLTEVAVAAIPLVLVAIALVALHGVLPHRTAEGSRLKAEADAYRQGLLAQEAGWGATAVRDADPRAVFARHLPYAVAFGAVPALVLRMRERGAPVGAWAPSWYHHPAGVALWASDPDALSSDLSSLADQVGGGLASSPSSSGGAGGVSAGGGFGGGGGGGW